MFRIRAVLSWAFVRGPAAAYELADSGSALFSWLSLGAMALLSGLGAGTGALVGLAAGASVSNAAFVGAMIGLGVTTGWLVLVLLVVGVLWIRGISPGEAADGKRPTGRHAAHAVGGWRRRGQPLVPGSLVGFFALMTVVLGLVAAGYWHSSRPWAEPTAVVDGSVVEVREPGPIGKGAGTAIVQYAVAGEGRTIKVGRDPGEHFLRQNDVVPIEYAVQRPEHARSVRAVEADRSDATFWAVLAGGHGVLGAASGIGYLLGRRRPSRR